MTRLKKLTVILFVGAMVALAGCNGGGNGDGTTTMEQTGTTMADTTAEATTTEANGTMTGTTEANGTATGTTETTSGDGDEVNTVNGTASIEFEMQNVSGDTITVRNVTLSEGGFLVVHSQEPSDPYSETIVGVSDHLESGNHENVSITLYDVPGTEVETLETRGYTLWLVAHGDTNGNQEFDFVEEDGAEDGYYAGELGDYTGASSAAFVEFQNGNETDTGGNQTDGNESS